MAVTTKSRPANLRRELHIWEAIGLSVAGASQVFAPNLARGMGEGLTRTLGLPVPGSAETAPAGLAGDPPAVG